MPDTAANLPDHEAQSVEALAEVHRQHYRGASALQRAIDATTDTFGRPVFAIIVLAALAAWAGLALARGASVTEPLFGWLELAATLTALIFTQLILVTQRREDRLADRRDQLALELALLADRRSAKIIELLEEIRRDAPGLADRIDRQSEAMKTPADPQKVLKAIDEKTDRETK